jgi:hypothetical protein
MKYSRFNWLLKPLWRRLRMSFRRKPGLSMFVIQDQNMCQQVFNWFYSHKLLLKSLKRVRVYSQNICLAYIINNLIPLLHINLKYFSKFRLLNICLLFIQVLSNIWVTILFLTHISGINSARIYKNGIPQDKQTRIYIYWWYNNAERQNDAHHNEIHFYHLHIV